METSKITKKGQITIPLEFRKEFDLHTGEVLQIKKTDSGLLIEKPMKNIMELKGSWKDVNENVFKEMKKKWGKWNEKGIARY